MRQTKPFHPKSVCTDSSKFHRNTQYIKSESTYNSDEESDKHTTSAIPRPAGQLLFSSPHPFPNPPEALQSGAFPQCYANHTKREPVHPLSFSPCPVAPSPPSTDTEGVRGSGEENGKEQTAGSRRNMLAWDGQFQVIRPRCL